MSCANRGPEGNGLKDGDMSSALPRRSRVSLRDTQHTRGGKL